MKKQLSIRSREPDREEAVDNLDFASAGPWDLLVLVLLTFVYSYLYLAVPKLSAQIYGDAAAQSYRPVMGILIVGSLCAIKPASRESSWPVLLLAITAASWAYFLKYATVYFAHDAPTVQLWLSHLGDLLRRLSEKGYSIDLSQSQGLEVYTPAVCSSIIDMIFFVPLTTVMVSMLRQRARKTQLPAVISMSSLFGLSLGICSILPRYHIVEASRIFQIIPLLNLLALASSRRYAALFMSLLCLSLVTWALQSSRGLSCTRVPYLLQCPDTVGGFRVRASAESITGRITVLENEKYRLLKADHSLLGGEWLGNGDGQSIFTAFYMQGLAVYGLSASKSPISILQIGLGIGTATKTILSAPTFAQPGSLHLDVVEIDAKVVDYAHDFFYLPHPSNDSRLEIHIQDARRYISEAFDMSYDLISHDVFSGGGLTYDLFTHQFFSDVKAKLKPGGILTVNFVYAPEFAQVNFAAVTNTLRSLFAEVEVYIETGKLEKINNFVFFCSDTVIKLDIPIAHYQAKTSLGRTALNMKHWRFNKLSVVPYDESLILQDESVDDGRTRDMMREGEMQMAFAHWQLMRTLLPPPEDAIWTFL